MLSPPFVTALAASVTRPADPTALEPALQALVARGRAAWPALAPRDREIVRYIAERWTDDAPTPTALDAVHAEDVALACACAEGERAAQAAFTGAYQPTIRTAVARVAGSPAAADDLAQQALERLLLPRDGAPRIGRYSGRAPLGGFVRVVALRLAISSTRRGRHELGDAPLATIADRADDPELRYLKTLYRQEFRAAFAAAVAALAPRDRALLRYQLADGLTIDQLATLYRRPRSTIHRHLDEARARLIAGTQAALRGALALDTAQLESVLRLVQSGVDVSLQRLLAEAHAGDGDEDLR